MKINLSKTLVASLRSCFAVSAVCVAFGANICQAQLQTVAFDDFSNVTLKPFTAANVSVGDGTDFTKVIPNWTISNGPTADRPGTPHVDNTLVTHAYNGWSAMDVTSWIAQQGVQEGRDRMRLGVNNNTALVADPDAWDDFPPAGKPSQGYTTYVQRSYNLTGANLSALSLSFDWDFVAEDRQIGVVDVSFDGGTTWQNIKTVASILWAGDPVYGPFAVADNTRYSTNPLAYTVAPTQKTYVAGVDFTPTPGATSMIVRFGCIESGNDWWFAVDNVALTDGAALNVIDTFEGLTLLPFPDGGVGQAPGDGTDFGDVIPNWVVDNSFMVTVSREEAFQGWRALDVQSWVNQQGGQQRSFLNEASVFGLRNTALVADSDAQDDFDTEVPAGTGVQEFNSYITRTYNLSGYEATTLKISLDWEFRAENPQRGFVDVSFDGGQTWSVLLDLDSANANLGTQYAAYLYLGTDHFATFNAPQVFQFGNAASALPAQRSNQMILRVGYVNSENNWWFAVDNIKVEAATKSYVLGDADGNGTVDFEDINPFVMALFDPDLYLIQYPAVNQIVLDFDADGAVTFNDINGMLFTLFN